jgi:hypothetical protein
MRKADKALLAIILLILQSCWVDPCNPDCGDSYSLTFRLVNKSTGQDLVFGQYRTFDRLQMKAFSIKGRDTTFTSIGAYGSSRSDSTLYFYLPAKTDTVYLRLNSFDIDTFNFTFGLSNSRCCTFTSIKAVNYNNSSFIPTRDSTIELRK